MEEETISQYSIEGTTILMELLKFAREFEVAHNHSIQNAEQSDDDEIIDLDDESP